MLTNSQENRTPKSTKRKDIKWLRIIINFLRHNSLHSLTSFKNVKFCCVSFLEAK